VRTRDIERDLNVPKLGSKLQELSQKHMARKLGTAATK